MTRSPDERRGYREKLILVLGTYLEHRIARVGEIAYRLAVDKRDKRCRILRGE